MAIYCVQSAEGDPSTSRGFKNSEWFKPRKYFSKQLLNCSSIRTLTAEMVKLTNIYAVTNHRRYSSWWWMGGQIIQIVKLAVV